MKHNPCRFNIYGYPGNIAHLKIAPLIYLELIPLWYCTVLCEHGLVLRQTFG